MPDKEPSNFKFEMNMCTVGYSKKYYGVPRILNFNVSVSRDDLQPRVVLCNLYLANDLFQSLPLGDADNILKNDQSLHNKLKAFCKAYVEGQCDDHVKQLKSKENEES